jgi:hypothetical protein
MGWAGHGWARHNLGWARAELSMIWSRFGWAWSWNGLDTGQAGHLLVLALAVHGLGKGFSSAWLGYTGPRMDSTGHELGSHGLCLAWAGHGLRCAWAGRGTVWELAGLCMGWAGLLVGLGSRIGFTPRWAGLDCNLSWFLG